ncbi:Anthranilate synthase component 1 [Geodia barretti]|uniref:anthranilate synthase n=1 Tax=Geodia barretti TaxID=519541 RepID=A0AA35S447_GEOBA|nr:Anthranilate synthase component 1 [Geodia barretti]
MESVEGGESVARYSFLGSRPRVIVESRGNEVKRRYLRDGRTETTESADPLSALRDVLQDVVPANIEGLPPFHGGFVGYLAYDAVRRFERLPESVEDSLGLPDAMFLLADSVLVFDRARNVIQVVVNASVPDASLADQAYDAAEAQIEATVSEIRAPLPYRLGLPGGEPVSNTSRERYLEMVRQAKDYVAAGDIIQVVPSQRFETPLTVHPFDFYRALRVVNPSPYMYYLDFDGLVIAGASPEMMTRTEGGTIETRPIAGTRPRGRTPEEDVALAAELLADEKERAEHVMLVDLARNDIGRVASYGRVQVEDFMSIERYSHVMHIVSRVRGELRPDTDAFDALRATFPAGTLSGAPKIRAMEIIDELETERRGVYGGAVGYFSYSGASDTAIAIRTLVAKDGVGYFQAGGGVVAESDPASEYDESCRKADCGARRPPHGPPRPRLAPHAEPLPTPHPRGAARRERTQDDFRHRR